MAQGRKRSYRKKRYTKRKYPSNKKLDKRIKKIEADQEVKQRNGTKTAISIVDTPVLNAGASGGNAFLLNESIDQGVEVAARIGERIRITSINLRMRIFSNVNRLNTTLIRCMIFWDRQTNGFPFGSVDGVTGDLASGRGPLIAPDDSVSLLYAHYNPYTCGGRTTRYKMLYDKVFTLTPKMALTYVISAEDSDITDTTQAVQTTMYKKLKLKINKSVQYRRGTNAGTLADIMTGSLWMILLQDEASLPSGGLLNYKINFKDE